MKDYIKNRHGKLFAGNREVVPGQKYTLATLICSHSDFFSRLYKHAKKEYYMPELIRDVLGMVRTNV